jgi:prepilin-type N-terminal cleavage/methylation domain-containing protein
MRRDAKGFTLIEVLIAAAILGVALVGLASTQGNAIHGNLMSRKTNIATMLAQQKMEELRSQPWATAWTDTAHQLFDSNSGNFSVDTNEDGVVDAFDWEAIPDHTNSDGPSGTANPIDEQGNHVISDNPNVGYHRHWNIADNVPGPNMKTIAVRVQWRTRELHSVVMESVVSEVTP